MKTVSTLPNPDSASRLSARRGLPAAARVDRENHVIYGAALIQVGALNEGDSRPWDVDATALAQVLSLAGMNPKGLKARWTHPNMSSDGLGSFLGRWRNPRVSDDGQTVVADLHLSPIAFKGENSRGEYVEDMAAEHPDAFGVSLFPVLDREAMEKTESGGRQLMRFSKLIADDVVDEPAATRGGFFGGELATDSLYAQASLALDTLFPAATEDVIRARVLGFVDNYLATRVSSPLSDDAEGDEAEPSELSAARAAVMRVLDERLAKVNTTPSAVPASPMLAAGIPLASFTPSEATAWESVRGFAIEYLAHAPMFARDRISLASYCDSRLTEERGRIFDGRSRMQFDTTLASCLQKQSEIVERVYPLFPANGLG